MPSLKLTPDEIKKRLYAIRDLHDDKRVLLGAALGDLMRQHGEIWPEDLKRALEALRLAYKITDVEEREVVSALFP